MQRRLELRQEAVAKQAPAPAPAPQVHLNFGAELAELFRPAVAPPPPAAVPNAFIPPPNSSNMLIPFPRLPGADLSIEEFCTAYNLEGDICERFKEHRFKRTTAFKFVEIPELKEMGFMRGEVAELKVAIEEWSRAPE